MEIINATDGYKLGHHRMYPEGTQMVYSNWTPRSNRYFPEATEGSVVFGIQYFVKKYLIEEFDEWFALPKEEVTEVGIPYKLGCGLAGGDWDRVVYPMLQEFFANDSTITLYIYKLCNN